MLLTETLAVAFSSLRANLLRSLLTMLGIIIGVGAVIAMIALGNGAQNAVKDRIARLGRQRCSDLSAASTTRAVSAQARRPSCHTWT